MINHGKACIRISEYFAKETGMPCVMNIWTGDGFKDVPADRMGPRMRYKDSIEQILSEPYDHNLVKPCVESKVFGIGVESYTVGSAEFTLSFAALHDGCMPLMDNGHYHPLEYVSDKIPAMLCFYPEFAGDITVADGIYVICGYTDMRKSIDGLCAVVKDQLNMNPSRPNAIYLFCGRRSDRIKVLLHEREGFVLLYKRLDANVGKYRWPRNRNEVKPITWRQFDWLMSGLEIEQPKAIKSTGNA